MVVTIARTATLKDVRKAMRGIGKTDYGTVIFIPGWGQIKKIGGSYAIGPTPDRDDSDPYTDYSAWTYGCRESWVLKWIQQETGMKEC